MNGTTAAYIDRHGRKRRDEHYVRLVDLATGRHAGRAVKPPPGEFGVSLYRDRGNNLDLLSTVRSRGSGDLTTWRRRRVTDGVRVIDTFAERSRDEIGVVAGLWYF